LVTTPEYIFNMLGYSVIFIMIFGLLHGILLLPILLEVSARSVTWLKAKFASLCCGKGGHRAGGNVNAFDNYQFQKDDDGSMVDSYTAMAMRDIVGGVATTRNTHCSRVSILGVDNWSTPYTIPSTIKPPARPTVMSAPARKSKEAAKTGGILQEQIRTKANKRNKQLSS
jgi:hypothetical protein